MKRQPRSTKSRESQRPIDIIDDLAKLLGITRSQVFEIVSPPGAGDSKLKVSRPEAYERWSRSVRRRTPIVKITPKLEDAIAKLKVRYPDAALGEVSGYAILDHCRMYLPDLFKCDGYDLTWLYTMRVSEDTYDSFIVLCQDWLFNCIDGRINLFAFTYSSWLRIRQSPVHLENASAFSYFLGIGAIALGRYREAYQIGDFLGTHCREHRNAISDPNNPKKLSEEKKSIKAKYEEGIICGARLKATASGFRYFLTPLRAGSDFVELFDTIDLYRAQRKWRSSVDQLKAVREYIRFLCRLVFTHSKHNDVRNPSILELIDAKTHLRIQINRPGLNERNPKLVSKFLGISPRELVLKYDEMLHEAAVVDHVVPKDWDALARGYALICQDYQKADVNLTTAYSTYNRLKATNKNDYRAALTAEVGMIFTEIVMYLGVFEDHKHQLDEPVFFRGGEEITPRKALDLAWNKWVTIRDRIGEENMFHVRMFAIEIEARLRIASASTRS